MKRARRQRRLHVVRTNLSTEPDPGYRKSVLLAEIGAVTPPVGINCFVVQGTSGGMVELEDVFKGLLPYIFAGFVMLLILCLFPQLALFLPSTMKG